MHLCTHSLFVWSTWILPHHCLNCHHSWLESYTCTANMLALFRSVEFTKWRLLNSFLVAIFGDPASNFNSFPCDKSSEINLWAFGKVSHSFHVWRHINFQHIWLTNSVEWLKNAFLWLLMFFFAIWRYTGAQKLSMRAKSLVLPPPFQ